MSTWRQRLVQVLPGGLVRRVAGALRSGPTLTVVVVVTDDNAPFLDECLAALDAQDRPPDEVLLMVIGAARGTGNAVERACSSWRVRAVRRYGVPAARAIVEGAERAGGELLMFSDAGDVIAEGVLSALSEPLADPSVDVAGGTRHTLGRVRLGDLMLRRALWARSGLTVPDGPHAEWAVAARLVLAARRCAPGPRQVRVGERRGTGAAFGTMRVLAPWAAEWSAAVNEVRAALADGAGRAEFLTWLLDAEVAGFLEDAERCTPDEWGLGATLCRELLDEATADLLEDVRVESRVRLWLAAHDRRRDLERFNVDRWLDEGQFPTQVIEGRVLAVLPVDGEPLPDEVLTLGPSETSLVTRLRRLRWCGDGDVEAEIVAFIRRVASDVGRTNAAVTLTGPDGAVTSLRVEAGHDPEVNAIAADRFADHAGAALRVRIDAAALLTRADPGDRWSFDVELDVAGVVRRARVAEADLRGSVGAFAPPAVGDVALRTFRAPGGLGLEAVAAPADEAPPGPTWAVTDAGLDGGDLVLRGSGPVDAHGRVRLDLRGPHRSHAVDVAVVDGGFEARLPLRHDPWRLGDRPLPSGTYRVHVSGPDLPPKRLRLVPELAERTPEWMRSTRFRMRLQRGLDDALLVTLAAPLTQDEVGPVAQQRLQRWYASDDHRVDPGAVYLQSYTGQTATDSPLAIHHALRRMRPDLSLHWAVADSATRVPEGARPVVVRSREWYAALARCGWIVTNIDMDRWFEKRPGQRLLQTYHGYPSKTMGIAAWQAKNFTPLRIERQLRRTSGTWDLLLTPTPAMDAHYRREYRYDGDILAEGYPRDDALVGPGAEVVREQTRRRLGLRPGQRTVLYAPTWRDDLATNFRAATMDTSFDVDRAARELGDGYVILLRGHRFHRQRAAVAGARLLDVTDYPEINDLVLASDVAVLDYSSLRFDFALTGRPMVFLVPDLDRYTGGVRGFLFDFRSSAPGPLVATTDEVVDALRDLDRLATDHRDQLARFNAEFNGRQDGHAAERVVEAFFGWGPGSTG